MSERDQATMGAISRALEFIDKARNTDNGKNQPGRELILWKSAAEAEYVAFRIAMVHGLSDYEPAEAGGNQFCLDSARNLLETAQACLPSDPRRAYTNVRQAVSMLRRMCAAEGKVGGRHRGASLRNR